MSENHTKINYEFLDSSKNFIYEARETGKTHSSFQYEIMLFYSIKNGDIDGVRKALDLYKESGLIIGHMSDNQSREIHYWAVATIAVAIHYAILGGLDESEAYQLSDQYIQEIDYLQTMEECIDYLCEKAIELVKEEIKKVQNEITEREINKAKKKLKSRFACEAETVSDIGEAIGYYMTVCDDLNLAEEYLPICESITIEDLKDAAKKYLDLNHAVISILSPDDK